MGASALTQLVVGNAIPNDTDHQILLGNWTTQSDVVAPAGSGILVKHDASINDFTTINLTGLHRRGYAYPIKVYDAFHWSVPTRPKYLHDYSGGDNVWNTYIYGVDGLTIPHDVTYRGTRDVYGGTYGNEYDNGIVYLANSGTQGDGGETWKPLGFDSYGANIGYFLTHASYGNYPSTVPTGRKLLITFGDSYQFFMHGYYANNLLIGGFNYIGARLKHQMFTSDLDIQDDVRPHFHSGIVDGSYVDWYGGFTDFDEYNGPDNDRDTFDFALIQTVEVLWAMFFHAIRNTSANYTNVIPSGADVSNLMMWGFSSIEGYEATRAGYGRSVQLWEVDE